LDTGLLQIYNTRNLLIFLR